MKWPTSLTLIRHDESAYNALKNGRLQDPVYQKFKQLYENEPNSEECITLAEQLTATTSLATGDHSTPLADGAGFQAEEMAKKLKQVIELPDIIFVSPYVRTQHTMERMQAGWPELKDVKVVEEGRLREQEHGLALLYNDRRIFLALHPEQRKMQKLEGRYYYRYPQGESVEDVRERTRSWFNTLVRDFATKNVLAVTHHLTILTVRANLERMDADQFIVLDNSNKPINAGVTIYKGHPELGQNGKLILEQYNTKLY